MQDGTNNIDSSASGYAAHVGAFPRLDSDAVHDLVHHQAPWTPSASWLKRFRLISSQKGDFGQNPVVFSR